jgi:hypothetical protein
VGRDSSVGIATCYGLYEAGDRIPGGGGARFSAPARTGRGAHPASCTMGTEFLCGGGGGGKAVGAWP